MHHYSKKIEMGIELYAPQFIDRQFIVQLWYWRFGKKNGIEHFKEIIIKLNGHTTFVFWARPCGFLRTFKLK